MSKKRLAIFGCGKLAHIVVDALEKDLLPEYELVGAYSNTWEKAKKLTDRITENNCVACETLSELLALKPHYIVETASPQGMKALALPALKNGSSIVSLSIGALADAHFLQEMKETAEKHHTRVYLASGAIGGFDVLQTASLMGDCQVNMQTEKGPRSLKDTSIYKSELQDKKETVFSGSAKEAIALFPTKVNVSVAAALASIGTEKMNFSITSTPDYKGDDHRIELKNNQVHAVVDVYSKNAEIAGWSVVRTLRNIVSPIVF